MGKFSKHKWWVLTALMTVPVLAVAADVPNMFTAGTVISSAQVNQNFKNLSDRVTTMEASPRVSTYVRWGRSVCPAGENVLYSGYAAGEHYTHSGGGSGTLCLPTVPEWLSYDDTNQEGALLYGTEYETTSYGVMPLVAVNNRDANCAVCEVPRAAQLMIPGRVSCPAGWTLEYKGYLMSTYFNQVAKSDWQCIDENPEASGSSADNNGHLLYPTEIECGSLPCQVGGYVQNREVACAVCTK